MKTLKIILAVVILQFGMQAHSDEALADLIKIVLGAKLLGGFIDELTSENEEIDQDYDSSSSDINQQGGLGYQYYLLAQKSCKKGNYQKALKWFKESKGQGYKLANKAGCEPINHNLNNGNTKRVFNAKRSYLLYSQCEVNKDNGHPVYTCVSGNKYYKGRGIHEKGGGKLVRLRPTPTKNDLRLALEAKRNYKHKRKPANIAQGGKSSFSDLWSQYGGSTLDSSTNSQSNNNINLNTVKVDTQPPVIRFNHSDSLSINDTKATISGVIKDSSKIKELLIKGKEVVIGENGSFSMSRYVRLGINTFDVVALDVLGNKTTKVVTITRKKVVAKNLDEPLDFPSFKGRRDEDAVALIIGLDKYESIASAPWAESDAAVFYDYAQQALGIPADRISLITGNKSDRSGIWKSLDRWLPTMVENNKSNVYVYFAGHGLASSDGEEAYLLPYDGDPDMLDRTAISRQEVINGLKDLKARSVTLFMDTCYSGTPKGGKGTLVADSRGLRIIKKNNFSSLPENFTIFSAAANDETASSHPKLENGLFSYWMMRGLGGDADSNSDRKITNGELHEFINKNVKKAAVSIGRTQNPQLVGNANKIIASW